MKKVLKLRAVRKKAGLTQVQLAKLLKVDHPRISRWERGLVTPWPHTLAAIAKALKCKDSDLV